jgi:hypothetical protein
MMEILRFHSMELFATYERKFILQEFGSPWNLRDMTRYGSTTLLLAADTECTGSADLIACLRTVPFDKLMTALKTQTAFAFRVFSQSFL